MHFKQRTSEIDKVKCRARKYWYYKQSVSLKHYMNRKRFQTIPLISNIITYVHVHNH